jgi:hypothetical protein
MESERRLGLDDLVLEMQNKFDQLEMMAEGLFIEHQVDSDFLDEDAVLSSVDSLILQAQVLEEQRRIRSEKDNPDIEKRIRKYELEFGDLHERKLDANRRLMQVHNLDIPAIMNHIRQEKQAILKRALVATASIVSAVPAITREELDQIYKKALIRTCKSSVTEFIRSFV